MLSKDGARKILEEVTGQNISELQELLRSPDSDRLVETSELAGIVLFKLWGCTTPEEEVEARDNVEGLLLVGSLEKEGILPAYRKAEFSARHLSESWYSSEEGLKAAFQTLLTGLSAIAEERLPKECE